MIDNVMSVVWEGLWWAWVATMCLAFVALVVRLVRDCRLNKKEVE